MKEIYHRFIRNPRKNVQIKKKKNRVHQKFFPLLTHDFVMLLRACLINFNRHCNVINIIKIMSQTQTILQHFYKMLM